MRLEVGRAEKALLNSIASSLEPEIKNLPASCKGRLELEGDRLVVELECDKITLLRAIANSIISSIAMLLEVKRWLNGRAETTAGSSANAGPVSGDEGKLR